MKYVIKGDPGKLSCARYKTKKVYDSQKHSRIHAELDLKHQHSDKPIYQRPIHVDMYFYMITRLHSKDAGSFHPYTPSLAKLVRFIEDLFKDVVIKDPSIIASLVTYKKFDDNPRTEIVIKEIV